MHTAISTVFGKLRCNLLNAEISVLKFGYGDFSVVLLKYISPCFTDTNIVICKNKERFIYESNRNRPEN